MIDKKHIGTTFAPHSVDIESGRLRFFAKSIGETNPIYTDEQACRQAGYATLPAPLTFLFCLNMEIPDPFASLTAIGVDLARVLHGEQSFDYHTPACAGDRLTFETRIADIYEKRGGALDFIVLETRITNQRGEHVADLRNAIIQRNA
jgi:acyl dehydratase